MIRRTAGVLLAGLLAGCTLNTAGIPREAAVTPPEGWRTPVTAAAAPVATDWWRGYGDPALTALVERALANNPDVATALARVREAEANSRTASAQLLPTLNAAVGGAYSRALGALGTANDAGQIQPQLQAAWQADLFGRLDDLAGAARAQYLASAAAHDAAALSVAGATASGYIALRALDARLIVARETLGARAEALRLAQSRADAGYTSQLELNQARSEYAATAQIIPQVERAIAIQENALSRLVGDNPRAIERGATLAALVVPPVPQGLPSTLLRRRPDIAQAELTLVAADRSLSAARKAFLPTVQLTGSAGVLAVSRLDPVTVFSIGGSILAPLFDAGRAQAGADAAAARRDQAAFAYRATALTAFQEVENALVRLDRIGAEQTQVRAQRDALAEALRHASNRYNAGYSGYLDQLDAQRGLLAAELALVQIEADRLSASVALYQAMGGGWDPAGLPTDR
ncbi:NodT family efflux transporter outer membrane factor (OMF) lipoprotein [Sphingomonas zeicaulis]|uniref:efflux transporter outer membrane subunit n=1 Tax=Sphingomonas zeicaulis TaxID=1632740 RepID=UPI003D23A6AF